MLESVAFAGMCWSPTTYCRGWPSIQWRMTASPVCPFTSSVSWSFTIPYPPSYYSLTSLKLYQILIAWIVGFMWKSQYINFWHVQKRSRYQFLYGFLKDIGFGCLFHRENWYNSYLDKIEVSWEKDCSSISYTRSMVKMNVLSFFSYLYKF